MAYLKEIEYMTHLCQDNNLVLNLSKTREMVVEKAGEELRS